MFKIILVIIIIVLVGLGLFFWFQTPKTKLENPITKTLGRILGFENSSPTNRATNLLDQTKDSFSKNTEEAANTVKTTVYNQAKTTLDNVFNKQSNSNDSTTQVANVTVLGVSNTNNVNCCYTIDLSKDTNLNLSLSVNQKYYLNFQNIPQNYCIYINNNKYPLNNGIIEIQFTQSGNFPIKANSCDLNDKSIGTLTVR